MSKGLDALNEMRKYGAVMIPNCEIIEQELKALEIIKKYHITSAFFTFNPTYKTYEVNMSFYEDEIMSEEEYNLSKEVLSDV